MEGVNRPHSLQKTLLRNPKRTGLNHAQKQKAFKEMNNALSITYTSIISVLGIGLAVALLTHQVHTRLEGINSGLSELSANVDKLTLEVSSIPGNTEDDETDDPNEDELGELRRKIDKMQSNLRLYLDYLQTKAYIDALTKAQSSTAYHEILRKIAEKIDKGTADFCVGIFDINGLKEINDQYGHEYGDQIIIGAAKAISKAFGTQNTYRIGGDEFAMVAEQTEEAAMLEKLKTVDTEISAYNADRETSGVFLAVSKGAAVLPPKIKHKISVFHGRKMNCISF